MVPVSCADKALGEGYTEGARSVARCFVSDDAGESWRLSAGSAALPDDVRGVAEPCVAETRDGSLLMLGRTGAGWNCMSRSADGGERWSAVVPTTQRAACAPLTLHALPDGRLIAFYDHADPLYPGAFFPRNPLVYSVSTDGGESWGEPVAIDDEGVEPVPGAHLQHVYPGACMTEEGIVLVYSTHYADPGGRFGGGGADAWRIGGGKRCILAFP